MYQPRFGEIELHSSKKWMSGSLIICFLSPFGKFSQEGNDTAFSSSVVQSFMRRLVDQASIPQHRGEEAVRICRVTRTSERHSNASNLDGLEHFILPLISWFASYRAISLTDRENTGHKLCHQTDTKYFPLAKFKSV